MEMTAKNAWYKLVCVTLLGLFPWTVQAAREVVIFGGGPTPNASQISIELNTRWIFKMLQNHYSETDIHTLYTDGNTADVDVHRWQSAEDEIKNYQPLARVFNKHRKNNYIYSSSHVADSVLSSDADTLSAKLSDLFANMSQDDELLLIYQGHGGYESADTNKNHFRLWGNTRITVSELDNLMTKADPQATIRFVLPQCFSGAFSRLIYKNAKLEEGLAAGKRCGFVAQLEELESEGCTDSVNTEEYRDYAYYFFSALDGKTIDGKPLEQKPDQNNDGVVTLREAHLYTLANAFSVDYSFSTSESFLANWQPWYLKWVPVPLKPDNIYHQIAVRIAERFDMLSHGQLNRAKVKNRIKELTNSIEILKDEEKTLKGEIKKLQDNIQLQLIMHWPAIELPYTINFRRVMVEDIDHVQNAILSHPDYPILVEKQNRLDVLKEKLLNQERELVQLDKIFRMRNLARILAQFNKYSSDSEQNAYRKLVECENTRL